MPEDWCLVCQQSDVWSASSLVSGLPDAWCWSASSLVFGLRAVSYLVASTQVGVWSTISLVFSPSAVWYLLCQLPGDWFARRVVFGQPPTHCVWSASSLVYALSDICIWSARILMLGLPEVWCLDRQ